MGKELRRTAKRILLFFFFLFVSHTSPQAASPIDEAKKQLRLGRVNQAISILKQASEANKRDLSVRFLLGNLYTQLRNYPGAAREYEEILSINAKDVQALNNLGYVEEVSGDSQRAVVDFQEAVEIQPDYLPARKNLAFLYVRLGKKDDAIREYQTIVRLEPNGKGPMELAELYQQEKNYRLAAQVLQNVVARNSNAADAWDLLAKIYLIQKKNGAAWKAAQYAVSQNPNNPAFLLTRARVGISRGDPDAAQKDAQRIEKLIPNPSDSNRAQATTILNQVSTLRLEKKFHRLAVLSILAVVASIGGLLYFWRRSGRKETVLSQAVEKWQEDLEGMSDLEEISEFLLAYFINFFGIPKGMFLITGREGMELKCTHTNLKIVLLDTLDVNTEAAEKWIKIHQGKPMTSLQAYKSSFFFDSFPGAKDVLEKNDMRLLIPFHEKGKILGMLLLGGVTKGQFRDSIRKVREKAHQAHLFAQKASIALSTAMLYKLSTVDEQTKVYNKRFFRQVLMEELKRVERYHQPCSLLMIDIDHFKKLNDTYGHPQGDIVLKELAEIFNRNVREGMDSVSRYGGEEFVIILPATLAEKARETAERIRSAVYNHSFSGMPSGIRVSISIGIASYPDQATTDWELIKAADQALYQSKKEGRNRVTVLEKDEREEWQMNLPQESQTSGGRVVPPYHTFQFRFEGELRRAQSEGYPVCLAILRVDNFEELGKSDRILQQMASLAHPFLRVIDFYSSKENGTLLIMFSEKGEKEAASTVLQICRKAQSTSFYGVNGQINISAGISVFPDDGKNLDELFERAEAARSAALKQGKSVSNVEETV